MLKILLTVAQLLVARRAHIIL